MAQVALKKAEKHPLFKQADWAAAIDIDEFLAVHVGDHTVGALLDALPQTDAISLTWRMFGNGGIVQQTDAPVTETFLRAAPPVLYWPWRAQMFKTLFRNDGRWRKLGVHRPRSPAPGTARTGWFSAAGSNH